MNKWIVTANRLLDGSVVYLSADRQWGADIGLAGVSDAPDDDALTWAGTQEHVICDPYALEVRVGEGAPEPLSARERIRAEGPHPTLLRLGYPAEYTAPGTVA